MFLGRKDMKNLDSILKSRDITLLTNILLVKAMVFPVVMYGCESWTIKKAECWRIDVFELWCWRRLLDSKEIQPVHPKWNQSWILIANSLEKTLMLRKIEDRRRRGWQRMRLVGWQSWTQWTWVWASSGSWWRTGKPDVLQSMGSQRVWHDWAAEQWQHPDICPGMGLLGHVSSIFNF